MPGKNWTWQETLIAFNYYCCIPFRRMHKNNPEIVRIAELMGRTPGSVSMKLCNIASHDPEIKEAGHKGLSHAAKADRQIWEAFYADPEGLIYASETAAAKMENKPVAERAQVMADIANIPQGIERERVVKVRVNQSFFRRTVLSAYHYRCCITGLNEPGLLNASHIVPWSENHPARLNPHNGLCLNILHHRAFDLGLMTITPNGEIKISARLHESAKASEHAAFIAERDGQHIAPPSKFPPSPEFLAHHNKKIYEKTRHPPRLAI